MAARAAPAFAAATMFRVPEPVLGNVPEKVTQAESEVAVQEHEGCDAVTVTPSVSPPAAAAALLRSRV